MATLSRNWKFPAGQEGAVLTKALLLGVTIEENYGGYLARFKYGTGIPSNTAVYHDPAWAAYAALSLMGYKISKYGDVVKQ